MKKYIVILLILIFGNQANSQVIYNHKIDSLVQLVSIQWTGTYQTQWNATKYSSGVYFYRIPAGNFTNTKKMLLIK